MVLQQEKRPQTIEIIYYVLCTFTVYVQDTVYCVATSLKVAP
jgi:hypothetical protein